MTIAHKIVGRGPIRVIALHGWFGTSEGWGLLPDLVDPETYTYALIDYRGYGARRDEAGEYTLEEISADTLALADELGWDRFALIGHSMGGAAALRVLADAPERITALIGISPVPASGVPLDAASEALFTGAENEDGNRYAILDFTTGNRQSAYWLRQMTQFSVDESVRPAVGAYLRAWAGADFVADLPRTDIPIATIVGEHDPALGVETMKATWMEQLPVCELDVLANAGHYAMFEAPVALATSIERVLARVR